MATTNTTTSALSELLPSIIQEALFVASERSLMRGLVKNYSLGPAQGKTINVPIYPQQTAASLTEGSGLALGDVGYANVNTSTATLTVSEVGLATHITDLARLSSATNVVADIGRLFGEAIARKIDLDLTAKFSSFTTNLLGNVTAASATITVPDVFKAVAKLKSLGVPSTEIYTVLHPRVAYDLKAALTSSFANPNAGIIQNEAMAMGYIGMLAGTQVFETSSIAAQTGADDFTGAVFYRDALGLGIMQDIRVETQRDALMRGDAIVATAMYGTGVLYESYGCALGFDSTI